MKKVLTIIISAIAFGIIAAAVFIAVNFAAKDLNIPSPINKIIESPTTETQTVEETTKEEDVSKKYNITESSTNYIYKDVSDLVDDTMPSVVSITNMQRFTQNGYSIFGFRQEAREYEAPASGSGVIVGKNDNEIIILTNNHVVTDSNSLSVTFVDTETIEAQIKGTDSTKDLAIISVDVSKIKEEGLNKIKVINLGDSDKIKVGEQVVAIGNALGIGQSVTTGVVSAKDRIVDDINNTEKLIQTDAAINPGNSGGALLDMKGNLIGINVAKSSGTAIEGMGYAIPVNTAKNVIETLSTKSNRESIPVEEQGYLGITAKNIDSQTAESFDMPEGIYVYSISEGSAASKSDLKEKDIIIAFDDQNVKTLSELQELLKYTRKEQEVNIKIKRLNGGVYEEKEFKIKLGARPAEDKTQTNQENSSNSNKNNNNNNRNDNSGGYYDPFSDFNDFFPRFGGFGNW